MLCHKATHEPLHQNAGNLRADAGGFPENSDVDNLAKFVLDALQGILYPDDRRIVVLFAIKTYPSQNDPRTNFGRTIVWAKVKYVMFIILITPTFLSCI